MLKTFFNGFSITVKTKKNIMVSSLINPFLRLK